MSRTPHAALNAATPPATGIDWNNHPFLLLTLLACAMFVPALCAMWGKPPVVDEFAHSEQIVAFYNGVYLLHPVATTLPGYHAVIALIAKLAGSCDLDMLRLYSMFLSVLCILAFHLAARRRHTTSGLLPTIQFMMMPILFPYSILVYTDIFALAAVVFSYYLLLNNRLVSAGLCGLLACCIRQTNIVWIGLLFLLPLVDSHTTGTQSRLSFSAIKRHCMKHSIFLLVFLVFSVFVYVNHGISVGMQEYMHVTVQLNNVFFFLMVFFVLYLPSILIELKNVTVGLFNAKTGAMVGIGFILYYFAFNELHPWNSANVFTLLRNTPLQLLSNSMPAKMFMFIPIACSIVSLRINADKRPGLYLLLFVSFLYLVSLFLVEPRYYMAIIAFYALLKPYKDAKAELIQTVYLCALSWFLFVINITYEVVL